MSENPAPPDATYKVRFSHFWTSTSRGQNSFNLSGRGEIALSGDRLVVRGFRREFLFMGSRVELSFQRTEIADVLQSGNSVSFRIATSGPEMQSIKLWTEDPGAAEHLARALPETLSPSGIAIKNYETQLASVGRADRVTTTLIAVNVLVFAAAAIRGGGIVVPNPDVLREWGTNFGPLTTDGQWWRLISSMFLHFGIFHLALNMWALWVGGRLAERLFGSRSFALLYFAAGIGASLSSLLWNPAVNSAGASGAIFGVYGAMLAFFLRKNSSIPPSVLRQQRTSGFAFIGLNLMNGFSHAGIDNAAHLGGLAIGMVMGLVLARPLEAEARTNVDTSSFYARGSAVALAIIGLLFATLRFSPAGNAPEQAFRRDLLAISEPEKQALQAANDAVIKWQKNEITASAFADRMETEVLPALTMIQKNLDRDRVPEGSTLKPLSDLLRDYAKSRLTAFQLYDSGARSGRSEDFKQAQLNLAQSEADLKLIKELPKGQ